MYPRGVGGRRSSVFLVVSVPAFPLMCLVVSSFIFLFHLFEFLSVRSGVTAGNGGVARCAGTLGLIAPRVTFWSSPSVLSSVSCLWLDTISSATKSCQSVLSCCQSHVTGKHGPVLTGTLGYSHVNRASIIVASSAKGVRLVLTSSSLYQREFVADFIEKLYYIGLFSDAEHNSTPQGDIARTYEPFDEDTIAVGAKRLRLRGSVAPAKVLW